MLESIYREAGLKVGLFTSPHLVAFGERIQVNRELVNESQLIQLVTDMQPLLREFPSTEHPTFFEVVTVMALRHFLVEKCDLVIWETGLGGRLDATNIVTPLASVITNIHYDHQKWLGETLASIAAEKAGIIKPGIPIVTATDAPEALEVIRETARQKGSPLTVVSPSQMPFSPASNIELPLLGRHQRMNAVLASATVQVLESAMAVSDDILRQGLSRVHWPGRLQLISRGPNRKMLLDGAHNVGGAEILAAALREFFPNTEPTLVLGILDDKDLAGMCGLLAPFASRIVAVPVHSERTAPPSQLAEMCRRANPRARVEAHPSLRPALASIEADAFVVIAGSLYLIGEAMELLGLSSVKGLPERELNEWRSP
jgi:dihydrofolate synthase/folylpolyglutamate synthase